MISQYAHNPILASNLSDITSNFYAVAIFAIIGLKAIFHAHGIDACMFYHRMKFHSSVSSVSLNVIKRETQNKFLTVPYCFMFYKNIIVIKVKHFASTCHPVAYH